MTHDPLQAIRARRADIRDAMAALRAEDGRLQIAEEVVAGLPGAIVAVPRAAAPQTKRKKKTRGPRQRSPQRPAGIPTSAEMVNVALADAIAHGRHGMRPEEIRDYVRAKWWPGVAIDAVGPTAWRMAKEGKLIKEGSVYSLPKNEAPAVGAAGASKSGPAVNGADHPPSPPDEGRSQGGLFSGQSSRA